MISGSGGRAPSRSSLMKHRLHIVLVAAVVGIFPSWSGAGEVVPTFAFGDVSCGAWASSQNDAPTRQIYLFWFRGFVSGYNYGSETNQVQLYAMPDSDTLSLYIDNYCRENPLLPFTSAAFQLVKEVRVKK